MSSLLLSQLRKDSTVNNSYTNLTRNTFISYNSFHPYSPVPKHCLAHFTLDEPLHLQKLLNSLLRVTSLCNKHPANNAPDRPGQAPPRQHPHRGSSRSAELQRAHLIFHQVPTFHEEKSSLLLTAGFRAIAQPKGTGASGRQRREPDHGSSAARGKLKACRLPELNQWL